MNDTSTLRSSRGATGALARLIVSMAAWAGLLFALAGTVKWQGGWLYIAANVAILAAYGAIVLRVHPDLIDERKKPPEDAKKWDKPFVALIGAIGPLLLVAACGLDRRFHWSPAMPMALKAAGLALLLCGGALTNYAVFHNRFFSAIVRIQRDRGHSVIDTGPYQFVRHPGYVGSLLHMAGTSLALGSWWSFVVTGVISALIFVRTAREDRTLREELEGYREYAAHVRYRLVPWVW